MTTVEPQTAVTPLELASLRPDVWTGEWGPSDSGCGTSMTDWCANRDVPGMLTLGCDTWRSPSFRGSEIALRHLSRHSRNHTYRCRWESSELTATPKFSSGTASTPPRRHVPRQLDRSPQSVVAARQPSRASSCESLECEDGGQPAGPQPNTAGALSTPPSSPASSHVLSVQPQLLMLAPKGAMRPRKLAALDFLPSCGCLINASKVGLVAPVPLLLPQAALPARHGSAPGPIRATTAPAAVGLPAHAAEAKRMAAAATESLAAAAATLQPQHPLPSLPAAAVDRWGSRFRFLLLRLHDTAGRQRFLVRGRNGAAEAVLLREAGAEVRTARRAVPKAPSASLEAVATGCMAWLDTDLTHLHITVQPAGVCLCVGWLVGGAQSKADPSFLLFINLLHHPLNTPRVGAAELAGLTAALVRQALPPHVTVTTGANVLPARRRSLELACAALPSLL